MRPVISHLSVKKSQVKIVRKTHKLKHYKLLIQTITKIAALKMETNQTTNNNYINTKSFLQKNNLENYNLFLNLINNKKYKK